MMNSETRKASIRSRRAAIREIGFLRRKSWKWAKAEFRKALDWLLFDPEALKGAECLWNTRHKKVYKVQIPEHLGGWLVAYKKYDGFQLFRHIFLPAQTAREAANYKMLEKLGLPMAHLLAAGEFRKNFILQSTFLVTEFASGYYDGRQFMPGGIFRDDLSLRRIFSEKNLKELAKVHKIHCHLRSFKPYNMLWKPAQGSHCDIELIWIDVANCHFRPPFLFPRYVVKDLFSFFKQMRLPPTEQNELLEVYWKENPDCGLTLSELRDKLPSQWDS